MRSRMLAGAAALLVLPLLGSTATATPTTAERVSPAPFISPTAPLAGEQFTVRGDLGSGKRPVQLQRRSPAGTWVTTARSSTTPSGQYTFALRTRVPKIAVRVLAPATRDERATTTKAVAVSLAKESAVLVGSGDRTSATLSTTLTPVRRGRIVRLQVLQAGWRTLQVSTQTSGVLSWQLSDLPGLPRQYRVKVSGWHGSDIYTGEPATLTPAPVASGLPRVFLATTDAAPVADRETYLPGTLTIDDGAALPMQIKGRGNGTWNLPKKPYRIKLTTKSPVLGMPTEKDWVLLANFNDRSLLRTSTAFGIASQTSLGWTPQTRYVDVSLNGVDIGSYQLVEAVEESAAKVALAPGGLLLEVDNYYVQNNDPGFTTARGTPIGYKDPDDPTPEQQTAVQADVADFESALYGPDFADPVTGYAPYVDLDSFADWYLVNEVMKNIDGDFFSSAFVSWDPAGRFTMGPVWDFDLSSGYVSPSAPGCCGATTGWWLRGDDGTGRIASHGTHWLARMTADPAFVALVKQRWNDVVEPAITAQLAAIPAQAATLVTSAALDWRTWRTTFAPALGTDHATDQPGEVAYLVDWLNARVAWMDSQLS